MSGSPSSVPVAVVGVSWRGASTAVRARFAAMAEEDEPIRSLFDAGYVTGAACVTTCSRTEWILTGDQPEWAGNLLRGALAARVPSVAPELLQVRAGQGAVHYLLRVVVGLDSVAEGESAVGRQVLKAFDVARRRGWSDGRLNRVWRNVDRLLHDRREKVPAARSLGIQSLVREALREHGAKRVAVLGRGDFGQAMERSLKGVRDWTVSTWSRQSLGELRAQLDAWDALVVCTGGAQPWLELPERQRPGVCVDAGSPPQVHAAPGWTQVGLDALLARPELQLAPSDRERLEGLVDAAGMALAAELDAPAPSSTLAAMDAERVNFLNEQLPALLTGLPPREARRVRQAVSAFTHRLLMRAREATS